MDFLSENFINYEKNAGENGSMELLIERLQNVWNSTRMIVNRGFTPFEMAAGWEKETAAKKKQTKRNHSENV